MAVKCSFFLKMLDLLRVCIEYEFEGLIVMPVVVAGGIWDTPTLQGILEISGGICDTLSTTGASGTKKSVTDATSDINSIKRSMSSRYSNINRYIITIYNHLRRRSRIG